MINKPNNIVKERHSPQTAEGVPTDDLVGLQRRILSRIYESARPYANSDKAGWVALLAVNAIIEGEFAAIMRGERR